MKTNKMAKKGIYIGAGIGLVLFAIIGLLPGSFIGGVIGINIASMMFGTPLSTSLIPRMIVGASMVLGVCVAGMVFVIGGSILGWLAGHVVETVKEGHTAALEATQKVTK